MNSFFGISNCVQSFPATRVSSQMIASTLDSVSIARLVMSPRLPIGVETIESILGRRV